MRWLHRLQSRAGLAGPEGLAAVLLAGALTGGVVARQVVASAAPPAPVLYAAADAAFARADSAARAAEPLPSTLRAEAAGGPAADAAVAPEAGGSDAGAWADTLATPVEAADAAGVAEAAVEASAGRSRGRKPPPVPTNINTASVEALQRLPRVGPAIAARIAEHRRVHGPFRTAAAIQDVRGIGPKTFEQMAPWIRL